MKWLLYLIASLPACLLVMALGISSCERPPTIAVVVDGSVSTGGAPTVPPATGGAEPIEPPLPACDFVPVPAPKNGRALSAVLAERIVGGTVVPPGKHPQVVSLQYRCSATSWCHYCGGTIVAKRYVLSAAHCAPQPDERAVYGCTDLRSSDCVSVSIRRATQPPEFSSVVGGWDVSIVDLRAEVDLTPVELNWDPAIETGTAVVVGWGVTSEDATSGSPVLREVEVPLLSLNSCNVDYAGLFTLGETHLCAGLEEGGKDSCFGDSGGPLFRKGTKVQLGTVSFGEGCARPRAPGIYGRMSVMRDRIVACLR